MISKSRLRELTKRLWDEYHQVSADLKLTVPPLHLLHGTSENHIDGITTYGLRSPYLTSDYELAEIMADVQSDEEDSEPIILDVAVYNLERLRADPEQYSSPIASTDSYYGFKTVEEWIEANDLGIMPYNKNDDDWITTLAVLKSCWYEGIIPPRDIEVL